MIIENSYSSHCAPSKSTTAKRGRRDGITFAPPRAITADRSGDLGGDEGTRAMAPRPHTKFQFQKQLSRCPLEVWKCLDDFFYRFARNVIQRILRYRQTNEE